MLLAKLQNLMMITVATLMNPILIATKHSSSDKCFPTSFKLFTFKNDLFIPLSLGYMNYIFHRFLSYIPR